MSVLKSVSENGDHLSPGAKNVVSICIQWIKDGAQWKLTLGRFASDEL